MHTELAPELAATSRAQRAKAIVGACVHCGFCNATCPTYQLLGNELDGPRGRIYLIKQMLEGAPASRVTATHLDRCLTCRACETTCPSGVKYGELVDIGRQMLEEQPIRGPGERLLRGALGAALSRRRVFGTLLRAAQCVRPLLPKSQAERIPLRAPLTPTAPAAPRAPDGGAARLRATRARAQHQCRSRARPRPPGRITRERRGGDLLRRTESSFGCKRARASAGASQCGRLDAPLGWRRRSDRDERERLRGDGEGLRRAPAS